MHKNLQRLGKHHESLVYFLGVACPLLSALTILDHFELTRWAWLFILWLSCGHYTLYYYDLFPRLRYRGFIKGLFVFGIGLLWPVWCARRLPRKGLRG